MNISRSLDCSVLDNSTYKNWTLTTSNNYTSSPRVVVLIIFYPVLIVVGGVGFVALLLGITRQRVFNKHPVCVYVIVISLTAMFLLLFEAGMAWISLFFPVHDQPIHKYYSVCKLWTYFKAVGHFIIVWLLIIVLVDRYLTATKIPRSTLCSHSGAKLATGVVVSVVGTVFLSVPLYFYKWQPSMSLWDCVPRYYCMLDEGLVNEAIFYALIFIPTGINLLLCFLVYCTAGRPEALTNDPERDLVCSQLTKYIIVLSVPYVVLTSLLLLNFPDNNRNTREIKFIVLVVWAYLGFAMMPIMRRELKTTLQCQTTVHYNNELTGEDEEADHTVLTSSETSA